MVRSDYSENANIKTIFSFSFFSCPPARMTEKAFSMPNLWDGFHLILLRANIQFGDYIKSCQQTSKNSWYSKNSALGKICIRKMHPFIFASNDKCAFSTHIFQFLIIFKLYGNGRMCQNCKDGSYPTNHTCLKRTRPDSIRANRRMPHSGCVFARMFAQGGITS